MGCKIDLRTILLINRANVEENKNQIIFNLIDF